MIKTKVDFLEGRLFYNQLELFKCLNCSDWLDKIRPSTKATFCFDHVNWLQVTVCQSYCTVEFI